MESPKQATLAAPTEEATGRGARCLLLAPTPVRETPYYPAALELIGNRHPDARIIPDAGLWESTAHWRETYRETLREIGATDLYILTAPDGTVGRGVHEMYLVLSRCGVVCRAALFPAAAPVQTPAEPFEELAGFELRVVDADNWRRYAVPVASRTVEGSSGGKGSGIE